MVSMKNPLAAILDSNRFTGLNYQDWLRNLNLVLASEKLLYAIEKSPPKEAPADISPEELVTLKQWWDDEVKARCYVMASMSNEMQRRFEKTKYAAVGIRITPPGGAAEEQNKHVPGDDQYDNTKQFYDIHRVF
ncbi:hypothetical protein F511_24925 [Dorcoceras hygrometricum]|uniref:Retrotransposon Copia-like N-terminal domain-containing protein n=1 Tax=Dorcoceras hygrometricum TaxID=472368 RepID=A0A2Z7B074_9LAMI|nr:hypothetical protein F511_24925 [Dorcoceras hygrometricum]